MAIPWLTLLKTVPWADVIAHTPAVAHSARKLWNSVSGKPPVAQVQEAETEVPQPSGDDAMIELRADIRALKASATQLHQQMLASTELIKELAEQNTALIKRVEVTRLRLRWLTAALAVVAVLALAGLVLSLAG